MPLKKQGIHWFMTDDEVKFVRDQLHSMRSKGVYELGKWYISGFNRKPDVLGQKLPERMPAKVVLKDITLRTAEQTPGIIAENLIVDRAWVDEGPTLCAFCVIVSN